MAVARGFGVAGALDHFLIGELTNAAEAAGFARFWANDTPNGDGLAALAVAQKNTSSIGLGVGVIPVDRRPAREIAKQIEALGLDQSRLIVGIGSGGLTRGAVDAMRDAAAELRSTLNAIVVVGALGPKMCAVGGRNADGALLNWLTPEQLLMSAEHVRSTASVGGQPKPWIGAYVRVALAGDGLARLQTEAERYASYPAYAAHFGRMGVQAIDTTASGSQEQIERKLSSFSEDVDEIIVRAIPADETLGDYLSILHATAPIGDSTT